MNLMTNSGDEHNKHIMQLLPISSTYHMSHISYFVSFCTVGHEQNVCYKKLKFEFITLLIQSFAFD